MTATVALHLDVTHNTTTSRLYLSLDDQDRSDLLYLIDAAVVKAKTPLGGRLAVLRGRLDRRAT